MALTYISSLQRSSLVWIRYKLVGSIVNIGRGGDELADKQDSTVLED